MPPAAPLARQPRLVMEGRLVAVEGDLPNALAEALDAVPGAAVEVHGMSWARRVGPDRAQSLVRVAERHGVEVSDRARAGLEELCRLRELSSPVIEVVTRDGAWLSLMDDWLSLGVEELGCVPGSRPRLATARVEVPLTRSTASAIARSVGAHALRLSPAAELALGEIASPAKPPEPEALGAGVGWIARIEVERLPSGPLLRMTTRWGDPPAATRQLEQLEVQSAQCSAPLTPRNLEVVGGILASEPGVRAAPGVAAALEWMRENPGARVIPAAELELLDAGDGARLAVRSIWDEEPRRAFAEQEAALLSRGRGPLPGGRLPAESWPPETLARLIRIHRPACPPAVADALQIDADADARRLIALSSAAEAEVAVEGLGGELMPFQRAGVAYALERRRLFIADEQGLGKTIQALATIEADGAYPAVVICPASLKLNWQREIAAWLPARRARSIGGRSPQALESADVLVINYEIVGAHLEPLRTLAPQALVLEEAHYLNNPASARTKAVLGLAESLGTDAIRLALTGTPVEKLPA